MIKENKVELKKIQLIRNFEETIFYKVYRKLVLGQDMNEKEKLILLKFAVIFVNIGEKELEKFGYKIILSYSNNFDDYRPLYDITMEKGYIPVAKKIEDEKFSSEVIESSFYKLLMSSYKENFSYNNNNKNIYFSSGQKRIYSFSKNKDDFFLVAPTSYGKSELIINKVAENTDKNICIIVPTKSLLSQTRKQLMKDFKINQSGNRIIIHPDMLDVISGNIVAVLTQERLLRLLQKHNELTFDIVLIDEAHNLIENDNREILAIQDLKILKKRNYETKFHFFTPFLHNPSKIKIFSGDTKMLVDKIEEFIKVEKFFIYDNLATENNLKIYDQFLNKFFHINNKKHDSEFEFIEENSSSKNIIYLNRPKNIEEFSNDIKSNIHITENIKRAQKSLSEFIHKDYNLIKTLNSGVVYHHGGMPENIRLYVEKIYSDIEEIKYIVTSSTLLQGVNIPAEKIFLLDQRKGRRYLNQSQFKNLIGRICRFSEIFKRSGKLQMLEPEVYLIKGKYNRKAVLEKFLTDRVKDNKIIPDKIENPLIKQYNEDLSDKEKEILDKSEEYQENIESGTTDGKNLRKVKYNISKLCFKNNIHDFDIFKNEDQLNSNYLNSKNITPVGGSNELICLIAKIFLCEISLHEDITDNFKRLENDKAKSFYSMLIEWKSSSKSYNEMINNFLWYWNNKKTDSFIYVGTKWGEIVSPYKGGHRKLYIDISRKINGDIRSPSEKVNIAIIRIKEEQDFINYKIMPYVEILSDLKLVENNFYNRIKYGTDDEESILLLREGLSMDLVRILKDTKYVKYVEYKNNNFFIKKEILENMRENNLNDILISELEYFVK